MFSKETHNLCNRSIWNCINHIDSKFPNLKYSKTETTQHLTNVNTLYCRKNVKSSITAVQRKENPRRWIFALCFGIKANCNYHIFKQISMRCNCLENASFAYEDSFIGWTMRSLSAKTFTFVDCILLSATMPAFEAYILY